jgi:formylglycine-generating enzyme required for sulfatase activity/predicted aspartyl protease
MLGFHYQEGRGVSQDVVQAHLWWNLVAARLPPGRRRDAVVGFRSRLVVKMTPAQLTQAHELARQRHTERRPKRHTLHEDVSPLATIPEVDTNPYELTERLREAWQPKPPLKDLMPGEVEAAFCPFMPHPGAEEEIPLREVDGVYELSVEINGVLTVPFILDTGASEVLIPADVALTLYRTGTLQDTDFLPGQRYVLADGSTLKSPGCTLRRLKIGAHDLTDIPASIGPLASTPLLGQSFLERLGTWGIDSRRHVLMVGALPTEAEPSPPTPMPAKQQGTVGSARPTPGGQAREPSILRNSIGMEFVLIPAGEFQMGSNDGDDNAKPVHTVRISRPFYLGKYEVTQAQWEAVMGNNPSAFKGNTNLPVENVSWQDVQEFINRLNARARDTASYRLPTEAEWEYAARAGSTTAYSFGDDARQSEQYAWSNMRGFTTHPVGRLLPNAWGLYDMHGNVSEWVQDWYGAYPSGTVTAPTGPPSGSDRVYRGGGWFGDVSACRSAYRSYDAPGFISYDFGDLGFRLLREVP